MSNDLSVKDQENDSALLNHQQSPASTHVRSGSSHHHSSKNADAEVIDPKALLSSLRRKWFLAALLGIIFGAAAAVGAWQYFPAPYLAYCELRISSVNQKILFNTSEAKTGFGTYKQTQAKLIRSPYVLSTAIRDPEVVSLSMLVEKPHPTEWLEQNLKVNDTGQEFLRVSLEGDRPVELAKIINAVSDAFLNEVVNKERTDRQDRLQKLQEFYSKALLEVRDKKEKLKNLAESLKTTDSETLSVKRQMEYEYFAQIREEFTRLRFDLMQASMQLAIREKAASNLDDSQEIPQQNAVELDVQAGTGQSKTLSEILVTESLLNERISVNPEYRRIQNSIREMEWEITDRLERLGPEHPALKRQQGQLKRLHEYAEDVKEEVKRKLIAEAQANDDASIAELRNRVGLLQVEKDHLEQELADWKRKENGEGTLAFELENLQNDIAVTEETASKFRNEIEALTIELQAPQRISLHRKAEVPHKPEMGKKYKMAGMAGLGMFGFIAGGIILLDYRRRRVSTIDEVAGNLRMRIIGAIPTLPRAVLKAVEETGRALSSQNVALKSVLKEAVDSARAVLLRESQRTTMETILITSASDGEGKTSVACQLATSLARAGRKVILVDCDLRRPTVHRVYGLDPTHGFCEVMRGESQLEDAIQESPTPGMSVIPAGKLNSKALQLLAEGRAADIYKLLKEDFEYVVIDTAPLLPVSDTLLLAQDVDCVIMAIQRDISRLGNISAAKQRLEMIGAPLHGAILIGLDEFADKYGYYSRHYNTVEV